MLRKFALIIPLIIMASCYSIKVDKQVTGLDSVVLKQNFFFLGLVGDKEINLVDQCPAGVSGFNEKFTFVDVVLGVLTVGIYTPKTVFVNCAS